MIDIDTTNMCSHLQKKLFEEDGVYHQLWLTMQEYPEITAIVRCRQLHVYRRSAQGPLGLSKNGKKILVLAGKAGAKVIREDELTKALDNETIK